MSNKQYSYPIDSSWSTKEMTTVLTFFNAVEKAYEKGIRSSDLLDTYQAFKLVVPAKASEKRLDKAFETASGYSTYRAVQAAKQAKSGWLTIGK